MRRHLRLGFAMGGGVSLGAFSGAALSQAIKLALYHAYCEDGYDVVSIDVFSGASAGAMSLGLMLRELAGTPATATLRNDPAVTEPLKRDFGDAILNRLTGDPLRQLLAAQHMQNRQDKVWGEEITLARLLGEGGRTLRYEAGLIDREAVRAISRDYIGWKERKDANGKLLPVDLSGRTLLGKRVLFCCTLSGLTPIIADSRGEIPVGQAGFLGLADGMRSGICRDLRVFDLHFEEKLEEADVEKTDEKYPSRWIRYHAGKHKEGLAGSIDDPDQSCWRKMAATAMACGAFPLAFEPVVLERDWWEMGPTVWPEEFWGDVDPKSGEEPAIKSFPFTYVDGGTFNNEPIREAFRLASFMDSIPAGNNIEVARRIIFVDPNVAADGTNFTVPIHRDCKLKSAKGLDIFRLASLDRLKPHLFTLFGAICSEASVSEADRVFQAHKRFELRDSMRSQLAGVVNTDTDDATLKQLRALAIRQLAQDRARVMIPAGQLTLDAELERVIDETMEELARLAGEAKKYFRKETQPLPPKVDRGLWLRAIVAVLVDRLMDMEGKRSNSELIAIAPFVDVASLRQTPAGRIPPDEIRAREVKLPAGEFMGFAGFMSPAARLQAARAGRYCAHEFMAAAKMVDLPPKAAERTAVAMTLAEQQSFTTDLAAGMRDFGSRISDAVKESALIDFFPGLNQLAEAFLAKYAMSLLAGAASASPPPVKYEFRIEVPSKDFEFDGSGFFDDDGSAATLEDGRMGSGLYLVTWLEIKNGAWSGPCVKDNLLSIDRDGFLSDSWYCDLQLPEVSARELIAPQPNPRIQCSLVDWIAKDPSKSARSKYAPKWEFASGVMPLEQIVFDPPRSA